jgi:hypothetical protein
MFPQTWTDFFVSLIFPMFMLLLWLIPVLIAFARLQKQPMDDTAKAVWILIILLIPIVGALTYILLFSERQKGISKG